MVSVPNVNNNHNKIIPVNYQFGYFFIANALTKYSLSINSDPELGIFVFRMVSDLFWLSVAKKAISKCISIPPRWPLFFHCAAIITQGVTKQITSTALADCVHYSLDYSPLQRKRLSGLKSTLRHSALRT